MNHLLTFGKVLLGMMVTFDSNYDITLLDIDKAPTECLNQLKEFESEFSYPFSDKEQFRIEHGKNGNYFSFLKQLGKPYFFIATCNEDKQVHKTINNQTITIEHNSGEIAAVGCSILRSIKNKNGELKDAWYICDLKVKKKYQGEHLPLKIAEQVAGQRFIQCPRGFGICMNPIHGEPKAAKVFKYHGPFPGLKSETLNLYILNKDQVIRFQKVIKDSLIKQGYMKEDQELSCKSTSGMKDYIIFDENSSRNWNLLHIQPDNIGCEPQKDADYMICSVENSQLDNEFKQILGSPSSTAEIVSFGMQDFDFNNLTSNQI